MHSLEKIIKINERAYLVHRASEYHKLKLSIPSKLYKELIVIGERPAALYQEFNKSTGTQIPLYPLLDDMIGEAY